MADTSALAALHARSFPLGWPEADFRKFLTDAAVFGFGTRVDALTGCVLCRTAAHESEVLTFALRRQRGARHFFVDAAEDYLLARYLYQSGGFFCVGRRDAYYRGAGAADLAGAAALVLRCDLCDAAPQ